MKVEQSAGRFKLSTWTEGWPLWIDFEIDGQKVEGFHLVADEMHDLRYCIDRLLAKLETKK